METKELTKAKHVVKNLFLTVDFQLLVGLQGKEDFASDKMSTD